MTNRNPMLDSALVYADQSWSVIPLRPRDKRPLIDWKPYQADRATSEQIEAWWKKWPDANIGVVTGAVSGIIVLDSDGEEGAATLAGLHGAISDDVLTAYTGKGAHFYYQHPGGIVRNFARKLPGLDLRGDGGYVVAPPSVHPSGERYRWKSVALPAPPPGWLAELLTDDTTSTTPTLPMPRSTLANAYVQAAVDRELAAAGSATKGQRNDQLNRSAFSIGQFVGGGFIGRSDAEAWLADAAGRTGLGTKEAQETIRSGLDKGSLKPRTIPESRGKTNSPPGLYLPRETWAEGQAEGQTTHYRFWTLDELKAIPNPAWLIEGHIHVGAYSVIYGPSEAGKSFLVLDWALCIATGRPWFGRAVTPGPVVFVVGEGKLGIWKRAAAWLQARRAIEAPDIRFVTRPVNLMDSLAAEGFIADLQSGQPPIFVAFDTLHQCMTGGDENSARDIGIVSNHINRIRDATGAAVQIIHHTGKNGESERGSSSLRNDADTMMKMSNDNGVSTLECDKQKDAPKFASWNFVITPVDDSCILELAAGREPSENLTPTQKLILETMTSRVFVGGLSFTELKDATGFNGVTLSRGLKALEALDAVTVEGPPRSRSRRYFPSERAKELLANMSNINTKGNVTNNVTHSKSVTNINPLYRGVNVTDTETDMSNETEDRPHRNGRPPSSGVPKDYVPSPDSRGMIERLQKQKEQGKT